MFLPYVAGGMATFMWWADVIADGIATWLECGQMLFAQVVDGMTTESITLV